MRGVLVARKEKRKIRKNHFTSRHLFEFGWDKL